MFIYSFFILISVKMHFIVDYFDFHTLLFIMENDTYIFTDSHFI